MTIQKRIILEEIRKLKSHPTADELFQIVRNRIPRISLGTIYRNLDFLYKSGLINKLDWGGAENRFDPDLNRHYHIRCQNCHRVDDIFGLPDNIRMDKVSEISQYRVTGHTLEFRGLCPECRKSVE